jgi:uncharacterized protein (UPF0332 family)
MAEGAWRDLSAYRLSLAKECLVEAGLLLENGHLKGSVSRSYYAIFNALRAVLAMRGIDFKKHSGVISYFQREFIKTGAFSEEISDYIRSAFRVRNNSDYQDFYLISRDNANLQIADAQKIIDAVERYLSSCKATE